MPALNRPRVSIVLNNYNYGRFLDRALRSAAEQTMPCEVIVVDDGSTDDSSAVLDHWRDRVTVIAQPNGGQLVAYQTGFDASTGDIVIFLDSDDMLDVQAAEFAARAFGASVAKVHFRLRLVDEAGVSIGPLIPRVLGSGDVGAALLRDGMLYSSAPGSGNAYRRTVLEALFPLPMDTRDRHGADFFCTYGAALFGAVVALEPVLGSYRMHSAGGSNFRAALVFGNAERDLDLPRQMQMRAARFRDWIAVRTGGQMLVPEQLLDFSVRKILFARAVLDAPRAIDRLSSGMREMRWLLPSLWKRTGESRTMKMALTGWAVLLLLLPRPLCRPLARYVCNPASR